MLKLKHLHLNNNSKRLEFESVLSFNRLDSLANIYVNKDILIEKNKCVLKRFAESKNTKSLRNVLKREYFNSINLLAFKSETISLDYNCNLTLAFIQYNIHFNLKSDLDLFFYMESECEKRELSKSKFKEFRICPADDIYLNGDQVENGILVEETSLSKMFSNESFYVIIFLLLSLLIPAFGMITCHLFKKHRAINQPGQ